MATDVTPPNDHWREVITNIARSFHQSYREVSAEDIVQNVYLKWFENWQYIQPYTLDVDPNRGQANLLRSITNWCATYCSEESDAIHAHSGDLYLYPRKVLKELMPFVLSPEAFSAFAAHKDNEGPKTKADPALGGDALATYADLSRAFKELGDDHRAVLVRRFVMGQDYQEMAHDLDISEDVARKRVSRGLNGMQKLMGSLHRRRQQEDGTPVADRRRSMSNAAALSLTSRQVNGE